MSSASPATVFPLSGFCFLCLTSIPVKFSVVFFCNPSSPPAFAFRAQPHLSFPFLVFFRLCPSSFPLAFSIFCFVSGHNRSHPNFDHQPLLSFPFLVLFCFRSSSPRNLQHSPANVIHFHARITTFVVDGTRQPA
jgi:hypothetical protein